MAVEEVADLEGLKGLEAALEVPAEVMAEDQ